MGVLYIIHPCMISIRQYTLYITQTSGIPSRELVFCSTSHINCKIWTISTNNTGIFRWCSYFCKGWTKVKLTAAGQLHRSTKVRGKSSFWSPRVGLSWSVTLYTDVGCPLWKENHFTTHLNVAISSKLKIFHRLKRLCFHIKECPHVVEMVEGKLVKEGRK